MSHADTGRVNGWAGTGSGTGRNDGVITTLLAADVTDDVGDLLTADTVPALAADVPVLWNAAELAARASACDPVLAAAAPAAASPVAAPECTCATPGRYGVRETRAVAALAATLALATADDATATAVLGDRSCA